MFRLFGEKIPPTDAVRAVCVGVTGNRNDEAKTSYLTSESSAVNPARYSGNKIRFGVKSNVTAYHSLRIPTRFSLPQATANTVQILIRLKQKMLYQILGRISLRY